MRTICDRRRFDLMRVGVTIAFGEKLESTSGSFAYWSVAPLWSANTERIEQEVASRVAQVLFRLHLQLDCPCGLMIAMVRTLANICISIIHHSHLAK